MLHIDQIVGSRSNPEVAEVLHDLDHRGYVDTVVIASSDLARRRLRARSGRGVDLAIALPRDQKLHDGAVLVLDHNLAIVVRAANEQWLRLQPASASDAIELGYHAGNLHWRVRFDGEALLVALEGTPEDYVARLEPMVSDHRVRVSVSDDQPDGEDAPRGHSHSHVHHHHHHHDHGHHGHHHHRSR